MKEQQWYKLYPLTPDNGDVVFIYTRAKQVFIASTVFTGNSEYYFYIHSLNKQISGNNVNYWCPVHMPSVEGLE